jgi:hypothetical protein
MLRKLRWQIPGEPLAAWYNWCQGPVLGCGLAVEKHWCIGMLTPCNLIEGQRSCLQLMVKVPAISYQTTRCNILDGPSHIQPINSYNISKLLRLNPYRENHNKVYILQELLKKKISELLSHMTFLPPFPVCMFSCGTTLTLLWKLVIKKKNIFPWDFTSQTRLC